LGSFFEGHLQAPTHAVDEVEDRRSMRGQNRLQDQLAFRVQHRNRDGRWVHIQANIFHGIFHQGVSLPRSGWFFGKNATSIA